MAVEELKEGDWVLSRDQHDPAGPVRRRRRRVARVFRKTVEHLRVLEIRGGDSGNVETIKTTDEHPFWVEGLGWVAAKDLAAGMRLSQPDGSDAVVVSAAREAHPEGVAVYNFEVEGDHTYFVEDGSGEQTAVWVHNTCRRRYPRRVPSAEANRIARLVADAKNNQQPLPQDYLSLSIQQRRRIDGLAKPMLNRGVLHGNDNAHSAPVIGYKLLERGNNNAVWHYGITKDFVLLPSGEVRQTRYAQAWLDSMGLQFRLVRGPMADRATGRAWETGILTAYTQLNGAPPPGNRAGTR